jgi:hypothetical protein
MCLFVCSAASHASLLDVTMQERSHSSFAFVCSSALLLCSLIMRWSVKHCFVTHLWDRFVDSFRQIWPLDQQHGPTWTCKANVDFNETTDRIDFVHYQKRGGVVELLRCEMMGPDVGCVSHNWPSVSRERERERERRINVVCC